MKRFSEPSRVTSTRMFFAEPHNLAELTCLVSNSPSLTLVGAGYSQGEQTLCKNAVRLSMNAFNKIVAISSDSTLVLVEAGMRWRDLQKFLDTRGYSIACMQSYNDFSVGGSISVNAHGRDGHCIVDSLLFVDVMLADTSVVHCSREENRELFAGVVGGYGAFGVILRAAVRLLPNYVLKLHSHRCEAIQVPACWPVISSQLGVLTNAVVYPPEFTHARILMYAPTKAQNIQVESGVREPGFDVKTQISEQMLRRIPGVKWLRQMTETHLDLEPNHVTRNWEMSSSVTWHEPLTRAFSTTILQEFFIPVRHYGSFLNCVQRKLHNTNVLNLSIRFVHADLLTLWSYALQDCYAFVFYINMWQSEQDLKTLQQSLSELIDDAWLLGGSFYLPYYKFASKLQFARCYNLVSYRQLKATVDPSNKFTSGFLEYYCA